MFSSHLSKVKFGAPKGPCAGKSSSAAPRHLPPFLRGTCTGKHGLPTTPVFVEDVARTVDAYQRIVRMLSSVTLWNWNAAFESLSGKERRSYMEGLLHPTAERPVVKYSMVSRAMGNTPGYLRRPALTAGMAPHPHFARITRTRCQSREFVTREDAVL